ncbi:MAG: zinc-binding dehydrogenase, partial [Clostridia bacterium]|nr:zinc-binding dehydrogenase [Clostridia bacterium]
DCDYSELVPLPDTINDDTALLIETVSIALNTIDKLSISKGEHVLIVGANNMGIILAQLLKYYQCVPIVIDTDEAKINLSKECGIYYSLSKEKDWVKEITEITGGRMANKVIYLQQSLIPVKNAFQLAGYNVPIAIVGASTGMSSVSFSLALKKELTLFFVELGYGNTLASVNILANKAIDISKLPMNVTTFEKTGETFKILAEKMNEGEEINDTIVQMETL